MCDNKWMFVDWKLGYGLGCLVIESEFGFLREGNLELNCNF